MLTEQVTSDVISLLNKFSAADIFVRPSSELYRGALRLEGEYYGSKGYRALRTMEDSGFRLTTIGSLAKVIWFGPFSRIYINDPHFGIPFISSSEMMEAKIIPKKFLSKVLTRNLDRLFVKKDTIMVSCSGTIGNIALCTADWEDFAVSQHAIRVIPKRMRVIGLIYSYLLSDVGQFLVKQQRSGSVIESIYEKDVSNLPIPQMPLALRNKLTSLIQESCRIRGESNSLLEEAEKEVWVQNHLQPPPNNSNSLMDAKTFVQRSACVLEAQLIEKYARLDATYYKPESLLIREKIRKCVKWKTIKDVSNQVLLIGKTFVPGVHKVEKDFGIPYYTGKELFKRRPVPETFITSHNKNLIKRLIVARDMTLITCAGTVGKVMYVRELFENMAVTHDAIRIIPDYSVHPGYIFAFLASEAGNLQLQQCSYGSVIPRLHSDHIENIVIPIPSDNGNDIGKNVDLAFDKRAQAFEIENQAISMFVETIERGRSYAESKWGAEY